MNKLDLCFERINIIWEAKWYHYVYYYFLNKFNWLKEKITRNRNKIRYSCSKYPATRKLNIPFTIECKSDEDK